MRTIRRHASVFFSGPSDVAVDKHAPEREQSDDAPLEVEGWGTVDLPPLVFASAEHDATGVAAAAVDADATHIELAALNADALQLADLDAWQGNTMFGPGPSVALAAATQESLFPPTAAQEGQFRASGAQMCESESESSSVIE